MKKSQNHAFDISELSSAELEMLLGDTIDLLLARDRDADEAIQRMLDLKVVRREFPHDPAPTYARH